MVVRVKPYSVRCNIHYRIKLAKVRYHNYWFFKPFTLRCTNQYFTSGDHFKLLGHQKVSLKTTSFEHCKGMSFVSKEFKLGFVKDFSLKHHHLPLKGIPSKSIPSISSNMRLTVAEAWRSNSYRHNSHELIKIQTYRKRQLKYCLKEHYTNALLLYYYYLA